MKTTQNIIKRGSTPSQTQKPGQAVAMPRKIVLDVNQLNQNKKSQMVATSVCKKLILESIVEQKLHFYTRQRLLKYQNTRTNANDDQTKFNTKQIPSFIDKPYQQQMQPSNCFQNFANKLQQQQGNTSYVQNSSNSPVFVSKQPNILPSCQNPFGVSDQEKFMMGNVTQYPSPLMSKKVETKKDEITNTDAYKELLIKYENLADICQMLKNEKEEILQREKAKDEQVRKQRQDSQKYLQENIILKRKNNDLIKQNKQLREQLQSQQSQQNEERKDNHEQILEMMYALRLQQQEEQMLQMAIQQSAEEVQNDPNYINIDNLTYEEMLELEEKNGKVSRGLPEEIIAQIPIINFNQRARQIAEKCTICQCEFDKGEQLKQLPCRHIYHPECVDNWLKQEKKCPVCKGEIEIEN